MAGNLVISTINGGAIGTKNAIINGNFGINQRSVSGTVTLVAGAYGHDRWKAGASGCTYTFATSQNVTTITITAGTLMQVIEDLNLQSGMYVLSWTGTAQGRVDSGSYGASGVTGTAVGGTNQTVEFGTGTVSLVQYEKGSVATPFEFRPYGMELGLCQRYFETGSVTLGGYGVTTPILDSRVYNTYSFKAQKRATPTINYSGTSYTNETLTGGTVWSNPATNPTYNTITINEINLGAKMTIAAGTAVFNFFTYFTATSEL